MNDERPIEKLLRRYANKRRDDAGTPVELHLSTRRLLQGEVARRFSKRAAAGEGLATTFPQVLKSWRKQLIWALPVLIVLGAGVWALVGTKEDPSHEFDLAKNAAAPPAPAEVVERSFKALETTTPATRAPAASLGVQPKLAYADGNPARDGLESSGVPLEPPEDKLNVALKSETVRLKQGDAKTAHELATILQNEPALKLGTDRVAVGDFAQPATADQLRGQTMVAKRALDEASSPVSDEKSKTKSLSLSAPAKSYSLQDFENIRKDYVAANGGRLASAPASKTTDLALNDSARSFKQEARGGGQNIIQANSQAFANRAPVSSYGKAAKSVTIVPVLANFQVEQTGRQLRVTDGDGSTYLGEMNLAAAGQSAAIALENNGAETLALKQEDKLAAGRLGATLLAEPRGAQNFACRVSGTNRTLNQQVVFAWNFVALTNELAAAQVKLPSGGTGVLQNNVPTQQLPLLLNNSVISGRAQLGNVREIEINAVPVSP